MNDLEILTLEAFLAALAKQSAPLPDEIQQRLQAIGENLEQHVDALDALAETHPPLDAAYQSERIALQRQGGQRQKRLTAPNGSGTIQRAESLTRVAKAILRSENSVLTTQDFFRLAKEHPELVLTSLSGSPENAGSATDPATPTTTASPTTTAINSPPVPSASSGIQRIVLAVNASDLDRQNYQRYLEELKRLNPDWALVPDRPQPDEADAYLIMYQDENYASRHAAYIATRYLSDFCQNLRL
jgi:hypothetical protein